MGRADPTLQTFKLGETPAKSIELLESGELASSAGGNVDGSISSNPLTSLVPPNALNSIAQSGAVKQLTKNGTPIGRVIADFKRTLPNGVSINDLGDFKDLVGVIKLASRIKSGLDRGAFANLDKDIYLALLKQVPLFEKLLNTDNQYYCNMNKARILGAYGGGRTDSLDEALRYGLGASLLKALLGKCGSINSGDIIAMLANTIGGSELANNALIQGAIEAATAAGNISAVIDILQNFGNKLNKRKRKKTIPMLLSNFTFSSRKNEAVKVQEANMLFRALNDLQANWYRVGYSPTEDYEMTLLYGASDDALSALMYIDEVAIMATVVSRGRYYKGSVISTLREFLVYNYIPR